MSRKSIVTAIKNRRVDANLTQKELADQVGRSATEPPPDEPPRATGDDTDR